MKVLRYINRQEQIHTSTPTVNKRPCWYRLAKKERLAHHVLTRTSRLPFATILAASQNFSNEQEPSVAMLVDDSPSISRVLYLLCWNGRDNAQQTRLWLRVWRSCSFSTNTSCDACNGFHGSWPGVWRPPNAGQYPKSTTGRDLQWVDCSQRSGSMGSVMAHCNPCSEPSRGIRLVLLVFVVAYFISPRDVSKAENIVLYFLFYVQAILT